MEDEANQPFDINGDQLSTPSMKKMSQEYDIKKIAIIAGSIAVLLIILILIIIIATKDDNNQKKDDNNNTNRKK